MPDYSSLRRGRGIPDLAAIVPTKQAQAEYDRQTHGIFNPAQSHSYPVILGRCIGVEHHHLNGGIAGVGILAYIHPAIRTGRGIELAPALAFVSPQRALKGHIPEGISRGRKVI